MTTPVAPPPTAAPSGAERPGRPAGLRRYAVPLVIVLVAVVLIVLAAVRESGADAAGTPVPEGTTATEAVDTAAAAAVLERRDADDPLAAGPVDAPVVLVAFSDYQCPYCALWVEQTLPAMLELADEGTLRIEWRDVNIFGADSERGARAAYAAGLQGRFWDYHHALFADGEKPTPEDLAEPALLDLATRLGLDADRFAADLGSQRVAGAVGYNAQEGLAVGATSTPAFLVGGRPITGAQPTEVFLAAIEDALARDAG